MPYTKLGGFGLLAIAIAACLLLAANAHRSASGNAVFRTSHPNENDQLQRIAALETELEALRAQVEAARRTHLHATDGSRSSQSNEPEPRNAVEAKKRLISQLTEGFRAEPVNPRWSSRTRERLHELLVDTAVDQTDFPAPASTNVECRSRSCRIEANYPNEDEALYGVQLLQSAYANVFPRTHQYSVSNPDGSVTIVMYASG